MQNTDINNLISDASANDLLRFVVSRDNLSLDGVVNDYMKSRKENILKNHPYTIFEGTDGRYRTYVKDASRKSGRRMIVKTSREKLEDAICEFYEAGNTEPSQNITLEELFPRWIEHKALHVEPTTINRDKKNWKKYYKDTEITRIPIRKLRKIDLDDWVHRKMGKGQMTKHQLSHLSTIMKQSLDYAVDLGIIDENPYDLVKIDRKRMLAQEHKKADSTQIFYDHELVALYEYAWRAFRECRHRKHKLVPLAVMFMFQTGLRLCEVSAVKYDDICDNNIIIRRMIQYDTGAVIEGTKGTFGDRIVLLTPEAKRLIACAKEKQLELGVPSDGYIFSTVDVPKHTYKAIGRAFYDYCDDLAIMKRSSHKARKTYISRLLAEGVNINTVRAFVGHKDERTTYNNYCFDTRTEEEKYSQVVAALTCKPSPSDCNQV